MSRERRARTHGRGAVVAAMLLAAGPSCSDPPVDAGGTETGTGTATATEDATRGTTAGSTGTSTTSMADETATTGSVADCWPSQRYPLLDERACGAVGIGDVDGDGPPDLVVLPMSASFIVQSAELPIHTYSGGRSGGSPELGAPEIHCCVELLPERLTLIDLNGDGQADPVYATAHDTSSGDVGSSDEVIDTLLRGPLGGYVAFSTVGVATDPSLPRRFATGDFGVGTPAVAATIGPDAIGLLVSDGRSLVSAGPTTPLASYVRDVAAHDLDGDGTDEVLVLTNDDLIALDPTAGGGLVAGSPLPDDDATAMRIGDIDDDGAAELVLLGRGSVVVRSLANASLEQLHTLELAVPGPAILLDGDQDGRLDLVLANEESLVLHSGTPNAGFALDPLPFAVTGPAIRDLARGDLDDDGLDELVVCDELGVIVLDPP